eukprot:g2714.t1
MYVLPLKQFRDRYGGGLSPGGQAGIPGTVGTTRRCVEAWQVLQEEGLLVKATELENDATVIFISHEWYSFDHPDADRVKTEVLIRALDRLEQGEIPLVDALWRDQLQYKDRTKTKGREWKKILSKAYIWFDWCCMPQPGAEEDNSGGGSFFAKNKQDSEKLQKLREDGGKAIRSIPAYIELSDMVIVVAPPGYHTDRKEDTCYRSWRSRGWCNMELYACLLSRHKRCPVLVINSAEGTPFYMNAGQALQYMSIDRANFSCCQRDHRIVTATQSILAGEGKEDGNVGQDSNTIPFLGDIGTIKFLLQEAGADIMAWRFVYAMAKFLYRFNLTKSALIKYLANCPGGTPLHGAAGRGDVAIVRQLLKAGADPTIRTDLGLDVVAFSKMMGPFPAVEAAIREHRQATPPVEKGD